MVVAVSTCFLFFFTWISAGVCAAGTRSRKIKILSGHPACTAETRVCTGCPPWETQSTNENCN